MKELAIYITQYSSIRELNDLDFKSLKKFCKDGKDSVIFESFNVIEKIHGLILSRIYFGTEFCEKLIPNIEDLKKVLDIIYRNNLEFTLLTPQVTEEGLKKIDILLHFLNQQHKMFEVVINDFGVLNLISRKYRSNLKPVLGRLQNKMKRMPCFARHWQSDLIPSHSDFILGKQKEKFFERKGYHSMFNLSAGQKNALRKSNIGCIWYREFLKSLNIKRVEYDIIPQGIIDNLNVFSIKGSFYYPWCYITSSRVCKIASLNVTDRKKFALNPDCNKECQRYYEVWKTDLPLAKKNIFSVGNTVLMKSEITSNVIDYYFSKGFDRIVFQPKLPL